MTDHEKWLIGLCQNDKVIVVGSRGWRGWRSVSNVDRTTATQIIVGGRRYRRDDGRMCGDRYAYQLEEPTTQALKEIDDERRQNEAVATIRKLTEYQRWRYLELDDMEKLASTLTALIPDMKEISQ